MSMTYYFIGSRAGNGGSPFLEVGLEQAHQRGDVPSALPQGGLQQVGEQSHVGGGDGVRVDLQEQGHHLEHVRNKFCTREDRSDINTDISQQSCLCMLIGGAFITLHAFRPHRKGPFSWVLLFSIRYYITDKTDIN